jgi:hypothetical protein
MKKRIVALVATGVLFVGVQLPGAAEDIGAAVAKACSACHPASKVCAALGSKDKAAWEATVKRMKEKGAALDDKQVGGAVEYLAGLKAGTGTVCGK